MCVEKPITGLANGLYAYYRALKDVAAVRELKPESLLRLEQIKRALDQMPDLSTSHPMMARQMVKDVGPSDMQIGAISLGILEGISPTEAKRLVERINDRGGRYRLYAPNQAEVDRALEYRGPQFTRSRW
jgi:hypothetical protein